MIIEKFKLTEDEISELTKRRDILNGILEKRVTAAGQCPGRDEALFIQSLEKEIKEININLGEENNGASSSGQRFKHKRYIDFFDIREQYSPQCHEWGIAGD